MMRPFIVSDLDRTSIDFERIDRLRVTMMRHDASLCSERALFYTQSFKHTETQPMILRKAQAFALTLSKMSLYVEEDSLIFGNQASRNFAAPIFPEYSIDWIVSEIDSFSQRKGDAFAVDPQVKNDLLSIADYWKGKTHQDQVMANLDQDLLLAQKQGALHLGGISMSGDGHLVPDYPMILSTGLRSIIDSLSMDHPFDQGVRIALIAALDYSKRYAQVCHQKAQVSKDPKRKAELKAMAERALRIFEGPAQSFHDAVQMMYLIHVMQSIESNGHSFCFGRFDQTLVPYYIKDLKAGKITRESALEIIIHFFLMTNSLNKIRPNAHTTYSQGYPLYSNLLIGGVDSEGRDATNELSKLCIEAMNQTAMNEPNFSMRYHSKTPDDLLTLATQLIASGNGMPSMFNDETAIQGLVDLGIPLEEARDYTAIGCVETGIPGKYGHRPTGMTYMNWGKMFEILLNNGKDPQTGLCLFRLQDHDQDTLILNSYDALFGLWKKILYEYTVLAIKADAICDASLEIYDADPFSSAFIQDCLALKKTVKEGGCRYDIISQSNIGPSVVGNSLMVIKKLIFDDHRLSLEQLKAAMADNWTSYESAMIRRQCLDVAKFGNDIDEVDEIVKDVFESYLELLPKFKPIRAGKGPRISAYTMSTSNITSYVPNGLEVGATPDGRMAKSPLNEGCSPTQGTDLNGPTAVLLSVSKLPNHKVAAGQLLNMRFSPASMRDEENLKKFKALLETSVELGIYHNQFNVIDSKILRDAMLHPQNYGDLIVRVAGYCAQFISLMPDAQEAIIARTENGSWS
jgi:pyruvate formate-lyase/glycerol dehydratase family glycyl radical enzyme